MIQKLNTNAASFFIEVEKFTKHPLNRKAELITIYDAAIDTNQMDVFRELCFTAKYLMGMMRILNDAVKNPQPVDYDNIKKDFGANIEKLAEQVRNILSQSDESKIRYFEEEFLAKSYSALSNLNELMTDLEKTKLYLNQLKREK